MKCLVFGGGGFLGSHLSDALIAEGHKVCIFDRQNVTRYRQPCDEVGLEWQDGDFTNGKDLDRALSGCDIVFHLVSTTLPSPSNDNPIYDVETNLVGTLQLLELARKHQVKKIIFTSSGGTVYGFPLEIPIKETHPTNPLCSYGITKLSIEKYLHLYNYLHNIDYCILRLANPFGERQRVSSGQGAIAAFLNKALRGERIEIWGDGQIVRDYVYIDDVVHALLLAIDYGGKERVFNIGSGKGYSLNEVIGEMENMMGCSLPRAYLTARPVDVPVNILDIERAKHYLSWQPTNTFRQGLERTLDWMGDRAG